MFCRKAKRLFINALAVPIVEVADLPHQTSFTVCFKLNQQTKLLRIVSLLVTVLALTIAVGAQAPGPDENTLVIA